MPTVQFNERSGAHLIQIPLAICIAKGITKGMKFDFVENSSGRLELVERPGKGKV